MEKSSGDDVEPKPTISEIEVKPETETIEDLEHQGPYFTCDLCDKEVAYKIAQDLLSGLATACVDSTTGAIFKTPASVAADIRKEMVDYLTVRSESFVAETVVLETDPGAEVPDHPLDLLSSMIDDFAVSQKSLFSRVSGVMLAEMREERIDEFTQGMEKDSFWLLDRREAVAQTLIKNVDFKNLHHCNIKFGSEEEVVEHQETCGFRAVMCENEGCSDMFSVDALEHHDSICPFKILQCEQHCAELLMRRDMDKHCITDCSMKLVNCPFYSVGCETPVPQCLIKKHTSENTHGHLLNVLQYVHKDASSEDAERWAEQIEKSQFSDQLEARDVRTFTMAVKDIEKRIGPFEVSEKKVETVENTPAPPSDQAASAPAEEATTAPPTDHQAAAIPSKERDLPSLSPEQDRSPPSKERDLPSLSPVHNKSPPPTTAAQKVNETTLLQQSATSLATTTEPEQAVTTTTTQEKTETAPANTEPEQATTVNTQVETETTPVTTKPEQFVTQKETQTTPPKQSAMPERALKTTLQEEAETTPSKQRPISLPTATLQEQVVITPKAVVATPPPEQSAAASSPLQDSATADVQEHATISTSTDRAEPVPSLKQAQTHQG